MVPSLLAVYGIEVIIVKLIVHLVTEDDDPDYDDN